MPQLQNCTSPFLCIVNENPATKIDECDDEDVESKRIAAFLVLFFVNVFALSPFTYQHDKV